MTNRRGGISGASAKQQDDQDIAALAAITGAIIDRVQKSTQNKQNIIQIVIYESSV